ncbi:hypothetical protein [Agrococcus jejuensis]|uniref:hypothetical protein n=1 Tax=Agrococcus jejuensis TaxID=399736 RepID=UPI00119F0A32|nr:hypothetical protein [Agrococcus jejuensis]
MLAAVCCALLALVAPFVAAPDALVDVRSTTTQAATPAPGDPTPGPDEVAPTVAPEPSAPGTPTPGTPTPGTPAPSEPGVAPSDPVDTGAPAEPEAPADPDAPVDGTQPPVPADPVEPPRVEPPQASPNALPDAPEEALDMPAGADRFELVEPGSAAPGTVHCYGDSLLTSICPSIAANVPGRSVENFAVGGSTSTAIAANAGAYVLRTPAAVTIPASGPVRIGYPTGAPTTEAEFGTFTGRVSIGGVSGVLVHSPGNGFDWRFTRFEPGAAVSVPAGAVISSQTAMRAGAASIIWAGTNNVHDVDQVLADVQALVRQHESRSSEPYWVVSVTAAWGNATSIYGVARSQINAELERRYGQHYVPLDEYIGNGAIADSGAVPTALDREWIASRLNPPVFHAASDWVHFNARAQSVLGAYLAKYVRGELTLAQARAILVPSVSSIAVSGWYGSLSVRGWAYDQSDLYAPLAIGITIDGRWVATTLANRASPELHRYGVPSGHAYHWSGTVSGGTHEVCVVAVGIGVGGNAYPACQRVTLKGVVPQGDMTIVDVGGGTMAVVGWAFDHANLYAQIPVGVIVDGRWHVGITAALESPYLASYGVPGNHAFFAGASPGRGSHTACVVAVSPTTGVNELIGCRTITLR